MLEGNEKYLFGEIDQCEMCPFFFDNQGSYETDFVCSGSPDYWHPCDNMKEYEKMTLSEVIDAVNDRQRAAEAYWMRISEEKDRKRKMKEDIAKKSKETRHENFFINSEIKKLRKNIKARENAIASLLSLVNAHAMTQSFMENRSINAKEYREDDIPQIVEWQRANERDRKELERLIEKRKQRNRERNKKSKTG